MDLTDLGIYQPRLQRHPSRRLGLHIRRQEGITKRYSSLGSVLMARWLVGTIFEALASQTWG